MWAPKVRTTGHPHEAASPTSDAQARIRGRSCREQTSPGNKDLHTRRGNQRICPLAPTYADGIDHSDQPAAVARAAGFTSTDRPQGQRLLSLGGVFFFEARRRSTTRPGLTRSSGCSRIPSPGSPSKPEPGAPAVRGCVAPFVVLDALYHLRKSSTATGRRTCPARGA